MTIKVKHIMKVVEIGSVEMAGQLQYYSPNDPDLCGYWSIISYGTEKYNLEEWLEKFAGQAVKITIERINATDETPLLANVTEDK